MSCPTPVLFLVFNRPDTTRIVFEAIRMQQPARLFIAADGSRADKHGEQELCRQTREIATQVDWECEVKTLFRDENLGCKEAVSGAISWFFEQVEEGIILEDDCLPDASFFPFCTELLERYRADSRVMSISGSNLLGKPWKCSEHSYFWAHGGIWGWATWRRAWKLYDKQMQDWRKPETKMHIKAAMGTDEWYGFYSSMFDAAFDGLLDTWDAQWFYTILLHNGLAINSCVNLVQNIGFGNGTHTHDADNPIANLKPETMIFPLKHPQQMMLDVEYLKLAYTAMQRPPAVPNSLMKRLFRYITRITSKA